MSVPRPATILRRGQGRDETTQLPQSPSQGKKGDPESQAAFPGDISNTMKHTATPSLSWSLAPAMPGLGNELGSWTRASTELWEFAGRQRTRKTTQNCCKVPQLCLTPCRRSRTSTTLSCPRAGRRGSQGRTRDSRRHHVTELHCGETLPSIPEAQPPHTQGGDKKKPKAPHSFGGHHQHR